MSKAKLWGGAFTEQPNDLAWEFGNSLQSDLTLFEEEFEVTIAHVTMLAQQSIIEKGEGAVILKSLQELKEQIASGELSWPKGSEDIHGALEHLLIERIGETAKKMHAGRSRNDQIATVTRLWLKRQSDDIVKLIVALQETILELARKHKADPMPGYTHQQPAQPITVGFWLMAMFWMLERDKVRFRQVSSMADECPLGSAALAGTALPIDRTFTAKDLGFAIPSPNALDAVSDRDFVGDALHACATAMQHLSRLSQEIVLFTTFEFGYVQLSEDVSTGSSIMPQKRNPDTAELIRGRSARALGNWVSFMGMMKALPLGYNRDQQDDKPPLFDSIGLLKSSIRLTGLMLSGLTFNTTRMAENASAGFSTATGVCDALVMQGIPFRIAHEMVGGIVKHCLSSGNTFDQLTDDDFPSGTPGVLVTAVREATVPESIDQRTSFGGPSPEALDQQLDLALQQLEAQP